LTASALLISLYGATLGLLAFYGVHRLWMIRRFRWDMEEAPQAGVCELPAVTVQLPIFNERTVAARLIRAAAELDYPATHLEIQVLDDSTDETSRIVDEEVERLVAAGVKARVVRRADRVGFKAGALEAGMGETDNEFFCVFDADFTPQADFLQRLMPYFNDAGVGMVQARWGHENRDESALTRAQATLLDGHFVIEHKVRHDSELFFNFNGTAGIWRRAAIESAGGWQHDTLTEDLDLSYRAQLAGWRFAYAPAVVAPAELPPDLASFKSQQHRWAKGSVQVVRKLGKPILSSGQPWRVRLEAFAHLTGNTGYPCVLLLALLLPLMVRQQEQIPQWLHMAIFILCTVSVIMFYERSQRAVGRRLALRLKDTLMAVALGIGMCVSQTRAVIEGLLGDTGTFVRTPKRGEAPSGTQYKVLFRGLPGIELVLASWFAYGIVLAIQGGYWGSLPFLMLFFLSFLWVGWATLAQALRARA